MKSKIKKILKKFVNEKFVKKYHYAINIYKKKYQKFGIIDKIKCLLFIVPKINVYEKNDFSKINKLKGNNIIYSNRFAYQINFRTFVNYSKNLNSNMTPDYSVILNYSIKDFKMLYKRNAKELAFLNELEKYLDGFIIKIKSSNSKNKDCIVQYLENIKTKKCSSFVEAIQRILFYNQLFWQFGYTLCGLGRLDYILNEYYNKDISTGTLNDSDIKDVIKDFYKILNYHFKDKSNCLYGDTGQIIIIGGTDDKGKNFENGLTYLFIDAVKEFNKPDPKLLLRVNKNTKKQLLEKAIDCMITGIGSPLLSNDDKVIPMLVKYGYEKGDAWNYVTAACWEPSPCGNSIDFNNAAILNLLEPFNSIFDNISYNNISYNNIEDLEKKYYENLSIYIKQELERLSNYQYDEQPLYSLFLKDCRENGKNISEIIPKYKNLGVTTLGISSVVNSIINIKTFVFDKHIISLENLNCERLLNFNNDKILKMLKQNNKHGYCSTNEDAILLTNRIINFISKEFGKYTNHYGGKFKFGISAPSYVENGAMCNASFDGRRDGEPFTVHISSNYNNYIDIMDFASNIKYAKNSINGNVVDYILSPSYIKDNIKKFSLYIQKYIENGLYQIQINVIDSKTLIAAKNNPEFYNNLIVRVWGFSAYFNDLPEEYQDLLIKRAQLAEGLSE